MPEPIITATVALRVLIGVIGTGYSIFATKTDTGEFDYSKIPEAIFGQVVGGLFANWLKEGTDIAYQKFIDNLHNQDGDSISLDLQFAIRKAQLRSTLLATKFCLDSAKSEKNSIYSRFKQRFWKDDDINWLQAVVNDLEKQLLNPTSLINQNLVEYETLFSIYDIEKLRTPESALIEFSEKSKQEILNELRINYYSKALGQISIPFSNEAYDSLQKAVKEGWKPNYKVQGNLISLGISNLSRNTQEYDWFKLVCIYFNEECKSNPRIQASIQKNQADQLKSIVLNWATTGIEMMQSLSNQLNELKSDILETRIANEQLHKITHKQIDELNENFKSIAQPYLKAGEHEVAGIVNDVLNEPILERFIPPYFDGLVERERLINELVEIIQSSGILILTGSTGMGKSTLSAQVANSFLQTWRRIDFRGKSPEIVESHLRHAKNAGNELSETFGCIIDDLNFETDLNIYESILGEFINLCLLKKIPLMITSQHKLPVRITTLYEISNDSTILVPELKFEEIEELATKHGCPDKRVQSLSKIIWGQTKGHPLLSHARVLEFQQRRWLVNEMAEIFSSNTLDDIRSEIRTRLSENLSDESRLFLYRLSIFTSKFQRTNALAIAEHSPEINMSGEVFDKLVGPWIERVDADYFRLSPLVEGNANKVFSEAEVKVLHAQAAQSFLRQKTISNVEFYGLLLHGVLGEYAPAIVNANLAWMTLDDEFKKPLAEYVELFTFLGMDKELFPNEPAGNQFARALQFEIAGKTRKEQLKQIAIIWEKELQKLCLDKDLPFFVKLTFQNKFFWSALVSDEIQFDFLLIAKWGIQLIKFILANKTENPYKDLPKDITSFQGIIDNPKYIFGFLISKCNSELDVITLIRELNSLSEPDDKVIWDLINSETYFLTLLIDKLWLDKAKQEHPDWDESLNYLNEVQQIADLRKSDELIAITAVAKAIIHEEYKHSTDEAFLELNNATKKLGYAHSEIENYRAKIFLIHKENQKAFEIWKQFVPELVKKNRGGRLFFCRDAELSAARLEKWGDVAEFAFYGLEMATGDEMNFGMDPAESVNIFELNFRGDAAFALWKDGQFEESLEQIKIILESYQNIPIEELPNELKTLHLRLSYLVTWIRFGTNHGQLNEPTAGFFSNPDKFYEIIEGANIQPYSVIWYFASLIELKVSAKQNVLNELRRSNKSLPNKVTEFGYDEIILKYQILDSDFDSLLISAYNFTDKYIDEEVGSTSYYLQINAEMKRIISVSVFRSLATKQISQIPFEKWFSDSKEKKLDDLTIWLNSLKNLLGSHSQKLANTLADDNAIHNNRRIAAMIMSFRNDLTPEARLYAHVTLVNSGDFLLWKDLVEDLVSYCISEDWRNIATKSRFSIINPTVNAPLILQACDDESRTGFHKAAFVLLTASKAVKLPISDVVISSLEQLANS